MGIHKVPNPSNQQKKAQKHKIWFVNFNYLPRNKLCKISTCVHPKIRVKHFLLIMLRAYYAHTRSFFIWKSRLNVNIYNQKANFQHVKVSYTNLLLYVYAMICVYILIFHWLNALCSKLWLQRILDSFNFFQN